ncbi:MAG: hypothetical protein Q9205_002568 [Flavoplaca limonia]
MAIDKCFFAWAVFDYFGFEYSREYYCGETLRFGNGPACSPADVIRPGYTVSQGLRIRRLLYLGTRFGALKGATRYNDQITEDKCAVGRNLMPKMAGNTTAATRFRGFDVLATRVSSMVGKIAWTSSTARTLFQYSRLELFARERGYYLIGILRRPHDSTYKQRRHPSSFDDIEQLNGEFFKHDNIIYEVLRSTGVLTTPPLIFTGTSAV